MPRCQTRQIWGIWKLRPAYNTETPNLGKNRWCFVPCDLEIWWMTLENNRASLLCCFKLCATFHSHQLVNSNWSYSLETPNLGQIQQFLEPCDLEIWRMTLKNNRAPLLCYFKLYASFRSHRWIQAGVTVLKRPIWVKIDNFLSCVFLKFDEWPWKTIGHLFNATSSIVHHFVANRDFKLELQSGNAQFVSNSTFLEPCDLAIWRMTLKNNRAPLPFYFKLCASFRNHGCIETWVTVRKRPIWVKFDDF